MPARPESLPEKSIKAFDALDFMQMEFPERVPILDPVIQQGEHTLLFAPTGMGKSHLALYMAVAVARGTGLFDRWHAPCPRNVLYIDYEMDKRDLQQRLLMACGGNETHKKKMKLKIINAAMQDIPLPRLTSQEGEQLFKPHIDAADFIIVDNLLTAGYAGKINEAETARPMLDFLLRLKSQGKTALIVHHTGKNGESQLGTSVHEVVMGQTILLRRPDDFVAGQNARFIVEFKKARNFIGKAALPFEAELVEQDGIQKWISGAVSDRIKEQLVEMLKAGEKLSMRSVAEMFNIKQYTANKYLKEARKELAV